jgi:uncharacterized protein (DUF1800 family)
LSVDKDLRAAIAVTRFGLGAAPGEIAAARSDPQAFLAAQIRSGGAPSLATEPVGARMARLYAYRDERRDAKAGEADKLGPAKAAAKAIRQTAISDFQAIADLGASTPQSFAERWALFWANHFTVSANKLDAASLVGPFQAEAIRPHVFGRFADLLIATSSHPAMLIYLDQARSIGPDSAAASRAAGKGRSAGLNENLAREIMELHTLGLEAGYSQADVTEFARAMTGWSVAGPKDAGAAPGAYLFREGAHEPGARTILGKRYAEGGRDQALQAMRDFAASPHTAHHLAGKIARHFVADDPPPALVDRLAQAYRKSDGDLAEIALALVRAPEAWDSELAKFKTPYEFLASSWRAAGAAPGDIAPEAAALTAMGQKPLCAPSPKGWPEEAGAWASPDGVVRRMAWSEAFAGRTIAQANPRQIAQNALGARLSGRAAQAIARAETRQEGLAILLMSPEFQRR